MEKYKICPNPDCRKHNKPKAIECAWCEADLSGVKPTDDATEAARSQTEDAVSERNESGTTPVQTCNTGSMVRMCESCGAHNPANARKCNNCGEDISDVTPSPECESAVGRQDEAFKKFKLTSIDGSYTFDVPEGKTLIGREEGLSEYLGCKAYVSRKHAEIELVEGVLSISNISKTNFTYVNNDRIADREPVILHDGDEIGLGGNITRNERQEQAAYFLVKVG